jgi:hypothetical protein
MPNPDYACPWPLNESWGADPPDSLSARDRVLWVAEEKFYWQCNSPRTTQACDRTLKCRGIGSAAQTRASARQQAGWRDAYWGQCGVVVVLATSGQNRDYAAIGDRLVIEPRA